MSHRICHLDDATSSFLLENFLKHQMSSAHRRVKKCVSAFRKSSGKSKFNVSDTFPIRFRGADTMWNAKEKNDRVHTHFHSNCVCLNKQDSLRRVSEDGFTRKRTMLTFLLNWINVFHVFKLKCSPFRDKIPQLQLYQTTPTEVASSLT